MQTTVTLASLLEADPNLAVVIRSEEKGLRPPPTENYHEPHVGGDHRLTLTYFGGHQIFIHMINGTPIAVKTSNGHTWVRVGEFYPTWHRI